MIISHIWRKYTLEPYSGLGWRKSTKEQASLHELKFTIRG